MTIINDDVYHDVDDNETKTALAMLDTDDNDDLC